MLQEYISTGQAPQAPRELLRDEFLERMGRELVRLCDNMERHGLVDYQMGVWEEEIIDGKAPSAVQSAAAAIPPCFLTVTDFTGGHSHIGMLGSAGGECGGSAN